jgi:hypothetical protein
MNHLINKVIELIDSTIGRIICLTVLALHYIFGVL